MDENNTPPVDDWEFIVWCARKGVKQYAREVSRLIVMDTLPEPLRYILKVVSKKVFPLLLGDGIPITKEELSEMFIDWYVRAGYRGALWITPRDQHHSGTPPKSTKPEILFYN